MLVPWRAMRLTARAVRAFATVPRGAARSGQTPAQLANQRHQLALYNELRAPPPGNMVAADADDVPHRHVNFWHYFAGGPLSSDGVLALQRSLLRAWGAYTERGPDGDRPGFRSARGVRGRVYLAREGANAQVTVPARDAGWFEGTVRACFAEAAAAAAGGGDNRHQQQRQDVRVRLGDVLPAGACFDERLLLKFKREIVNAGAPRALDGLDLGDCGAEMSPADWHAALERADEGREGGEGRVGDSNQPPPVVLDVRNFFESDGGRFDGAVPLDTDTFRPFHF